MIPALGWAAALLGAAPGCTGTCQGAGCASGYAGALGVVIDAGPRRVAGDRSPLNNFAEVAGTLAQGPDWDLALVPGALLAGSPVDGAVRAFDLTESGDRLTSDATGLLQLSDTDRGFGAALAVLPDINGDGVADLAVGAPSDRRSGLTRRDGAVYVLDGAGVAFTGVVDVADLLLARLVGSDEGGTFGAALAACPDLDGDGLSELLVGAPLDNLSWTSATLSLAGSATLVLGADLESIGGDGRVADLGRTFTGTSVGARAGSALSCSHDLTGDGVPDLLIGAPFADGALDPATVGRDTGDELREAAGAVWVIDGAAAVSGALTADGPASLAAAATARLSGPFTEGWSGWQVATGDLDGDGLADVAAGAPGADEARGQVLIWTGNQLARGITSFPQFRVLGADAGDGLGRGLAVADVDGDGIDDLLAGAPRRNTESRGATFDAGALYLFRGVTGWAGWTANRPVADADGRWQAAQAYLRTGRLIRTGDFDGDGDADFALLHRFAP